MVRVLHVIDRLSGAGPIRSMIALVKYLSRLGVPQQHRALALNGDAYPLALILAKQAGMTILRAPSDELLCEEIAAADIVHLHYWSNPAIGEWLRKDLPAMRLLIWFKIHGRHAPQVITPGLIAHADVAVATTPATLELPVVREAMEAPGSPGVDVVAGIADLDRLHDLQPRPHAMFNVGYIGTVNFTTMHPRFVAMSAAVRVPAVRFVVCGAGESELLLSAAGCLGVADRFEMRGYVENIRAVLETLDVFGYPLCEDTYATSEKSLQEAMLAGVPPVVFPYGGVQHLVRHGETGLVVHSEAEYGRAIEHLFRHPAERARLGAAAGEFARRHYGAENCVDQLHGLYRRLLETPKRRRTWRNPPPASGAACFVDSLGHQAAPFARSLRARLVLEHQGQHLRALAEYRSAVALGCAHPRLRWYQARAAAGVGAAEFVRENLRQVVREAPEIDAARQMLERLETRPG